ncbi:hypothetical protein SteCoe_23335 [Stentor coeruleus]|uniref:non-specific serine/threonine protein kinase n=1 Tax=Stentor coeruleus TaxID=5963 RepID=A0A1R2BK50_9CILI|nr:hypothetical protein SteCoe_23335 [Stentor coeruleus]
MSLKDFEIQNKLGEGAFSSVYKVVRKADNQIYALKQVKLTGLSLKEKENALNEIRILASFDHPHIIGFKEAFLDDSLSLICIVMELAEGGDLLNLINSHKKSKTRIPEYEIWEILNQCAQALQSLHSNKILHRDLKSANIFLTANKIVKLGDLNVSKVVKGGMAYTQTGTPYYASPEVWKDQPYNSASDIWSLGCVIYELCSLNPPFMGRDMNALCRNVIRGVFTDIPGISKDLMRIIKLMLNVTPSIRPSAKEILDLPAVSPTKALDKPLESYQLLKTINFNEKVSTLRSRLPNSQYKRKLSADLFKENLPIIEENDEKPANSSAVIEKPMLLPKIHIPKALPPKGPKGLAQGGSPNIPKPVFKSPQIHTKIVRPPTIITYSPRENTSIKRIGSVIMESKRHISPQNLDRIVSLGVLEKPYSPTPQWWG